VIFGDYSRLGKHCGWVGLGFLRIGLVGKCGAFLGGAPKFLVPGPMVMKYAFVAEHRSQYSVRRMCRCLNIHPNGFYAWIKNPLSRRRLEDARQAKLLKDAWKDSGKVYGCRKLHDDLVESAVRTGLPDWPGLRVYALRSATNASLAAMEEDHPWSSIIHWTDSPMLPRPIRWVGSIRNSVYEGQPMRLKRIIC
jgi:hypothetical protein